MSKREDLDFIATDNEGRSALSDACENGHARVGKFLVKTIKEKLGNDEMVKILNKPDEDGLTPLYLVFCCGLGGIASYLLSFERCDFRSAESRSGWTPLQMSAWNGHFGLVKSILEIPHFLKDEKKEYLEMEDKKGRKAIDLAREKSRTEIVEVSVYILFSTRPSHALLGLFVPKTHK